MLTTNQQLDQIAAVQVDFTTKNMLHGTLLEGLVENRELFQVSII
jgi:hypothetical protein